MARFPRERRIRRAAEIRAVVQGGQRYESASLRLHLVRAGLLGRDAGPRAAVIVPRFGHTAVERNRVKRRLREIVRLHFLEAPELRGGDFVIRARAGAYGRGYDHLRGELLRVLERIASTGGT
ncbi:MAG: ribonuclease P protein component [Gemmatimonadetes bacterium]|nr:ribonuclease P protein component [Gemmatimonadota bacterium]